MRPSPACAHPPFALLVCLGVILSSGVGCSACGTAEASRDPAPAEDPPSPREGSDHPARPTVAAAEAEEPTLEGDTAERDAEGNVEVGADRGAGPDLEVAIPFAPSPAPHIDLATVATCERLRVPEEGAVEILDDIVYSPGGGAPVGLDLARPRVEGLRPAVLLIHGGGWRVGEKAHLRKSMKALAGRGYVAASLDYRLTNGGENAFPAAAADVRCAVRFLRAESERFGIDPDRLAAVGFSAGGHLAALLATGGEVDDLDDGTCAVEGSPRVRAAAAFFAPHDLRRRVGRQNSRRLVANFLGASPRDNPRQARLASPIAHVDAADAPLLLVHGTADPVVDLRQSRLMHRALRRSGVSAHLVEIERGSHGFGLLSPNPILEPATCTTLDFLRRTLAIGE